MEVDRRGLFRTAALGLTLWLTRGAAAESKGAGASGTSGAPRQTALGIHRATRNTWRGAIGTRLRAIGRRPERFKAYPDRPRIALPAPSFERGRAVFEIEGERPAARFDGAALELAELSRLLFLTNAVTDRSGRIGLRAAPSAGALYAGEVYVVAGRVSGLAPGVYSYHAGRHDLVALGETAALSELAGALAQPAAADGAAAAVLLSNVFGRSTARYANRGYRYALIDSGHIGENLRLAAWELALAEAAPLRFEDERLNELLGVDGREEAVCAVHLLGRAGAGEAAAAGGTRGLAERQGHGPLPADLTAPERYHEATKLVAADGPAAAGPAAEAALTSAAASPARTHEASGQDGDPPGATLHASIRQRRSAARFEPAPLSRSALLRILGLARGHAALHRTPHLDLYCVANRVSDVARGLYRYDAATRTLESRRDEDLTERLVRACLGQAKSGEAAVALIGVAQIAEASARGGARAYRDLLLDAGATAQRIYVGAEALGLAARNLAAYFDDELDALLGLDSVHQVAVHLTALGPGD